MKEDLFFHGVKALIKNTKWEILLLQVNMKWRINPPDYPYRDFPGGRVERGLSMIENLRREISEEIGITDVVVWNYLWVSLSEIRIAKWDVDYGLFLSVYECFIDESMSIQLSDEHIWYKRFTIEETKQLLGVKYNNNFIDLLV